VTARQRFLSALEREVGSGRQSDLAGALGISEAYLSRLRAGKLGPGRRVVRAVRDRYPGLWALLAEAIKEGA
jgi:hypothetical protein